MAGIRGHEGMRERRRDWCVRGRVRGRVRARAWIGSSADSWHETLRSLTRPIFKRKQKTCAYHCFLLLLIIKKNKLKYKKGKTLSKNKFKSKKMNFYL
jgi:hypothetical protein